MPLPFDAVLLAGGRASRVGGRDKTAFLVAGTTLLDRALEAARGARRTVVVGLRPEVVPPDGVVVTREDPPWSGPVAALAAGLAALPEPEAPRVLVLACDLPRAPEAVRALFEGALGSDSSENAEGVVAVDDDGRRQPLLALYSAPALRRRLDDLALGGSVAGLSFRRLLAGLALVEVPVPSRLCADVDTPDDVDRLGVEWPLEPSTD